MTALAKGIYTLAFIALSMMQPTGVWFCTVTKSVCAVPSPDCCSIQLLDCCSEDADQPDESPCCVEVDGEWEAVPSPKVAEVPAPSVVDLFLRGTSELSPALLPDRPEKFAFADTDPPPLRSATRDVFCVRLI